MRRALSVLILLLIALPVAAQDLECPEYEGITCDGWVTDAAGVLANEEALEATAGRFVENTGHEIAVVLVDEADGDPRGFAEDLGNTWGVGDPSEDDGVVVLVALEERRIEIVTGPGAFLPESTLSDIAASGADFFGAGDFDGGLSAVLTQLQAQYSGGGPGEGGTDGGISEPTPQPSGSRWAVPLVGLGILVLGAGGAFYVVRRNNRQEQLVKHRRVVDQVLARLEPSGHEIVIPDELLIDSPQPVSDPVTADAVAALEDLETAPEEILTALWARDVIEVGDPAQIERYRAMPLEMRVSGEQELLEDAVQATARQASE